MSSLPQPVAYEIKPPHEPRVVEATWLVFNRQLSRDAAAFPNESLIEKRLERLQELEIDDRRVFWLSVSRLAEMALKLAGDYADNCEFQAAGDLLVNPRQIDVYRRGCSSPMTKRRHGSLSDQFSKDIGCENNVAWLKRETQVHIRHEALLPHLKQMLFSSGFMTPAYLSSLNQRSCRVADTIAFLTAWPVRDSAELVQRMESADPADKEMLAAHLCRFSHEDFDAMGHEIDGMVLNGDHDSRYLTPVRIA